MDYRLNQQDECADCRFWERSPKEGDRFGLCASLAVMEIDGRYVVFHGPPEDRRPEHADNRAATDMEFGCCWFEERE